MNIIPASYEFLTEVDGDEILRQIERIGRTCYKSEYRITDESAKPFVANLIKRGHEAMLEHCIVSVRFYIDRGCSHEVVRHRIGVAFAQESTRYCSYTKTQFGGEVTYIDISGGMAEDSRVSALSAEQQDAIYQEWLAACADAERHYMKMLELGATPQIARAALNNSTKTELVVTMNLREWRHFFKLRTAPNAHPQMREVTVPLLKDFRHMIPVVFDDIEVK